MSETKNARLNDLSPDEFRRLYDGFAIKDARIAELEAVIRDALPHMKNWAYRQAMEVTERMRLLTEGEGNE